MDKRRIASYGCFAVFSVLDILVTMLIPFIWLLFLSTKNQESLKIEVYILLAIFFVITSTIFCYGIPIILTSVQFYLKKELFKVQLFLLLVSLTIANSIVFIVFLFAYFG